MSKEMLASSSLYDEELLRSFEEHIGSKVPRKDPITNQILNPTPLIDITDSLLDCCRTALNLRVSSQDVRIFGKLDSEIYGGSVKIRPAVEIIRDAIRSGKLRRGQAVFEATSGNFGLALGLLRGLGIDVVVLVSRRLQEGVLDELKRTEVKRVDLDIDICPAPGMKTEQNMLVAKSVAANVRAQLAKFGFDPSAFDRSRSEIESLLAKQDVINLAKLLAKIYGGFCPEQYDNELNARAHEEVTGPELDQQLKNNEQSLGDYDVVCAFGTGGTTTGLSRYIDRTFHKKAVHAVFPLSNQDVAGIRTKEKAIGLKLYQPTLYAGEHEADFAPAKAVLRYFLRKGYDIGESSALTLYACAQFLNFGVGKKFIVILADGASKYGRTIQSLSEPEVVHEVSLEEARTSLEDYGGILWAHGMFSPKEEGKELIATSLGVGDDKVHVATARDVNTLLATQRIPDGLRELLPEKNGKALLVVCMVGGTSLQVAKILEEKGIRAVSLVGGITGLSGGRQIPELVQVARE
jgi:cysteine synthase A